MTEDILRVLSTLNGYDVREKFSQKPFSLIDKTPIITVSENCEAQSLEPINGGENVVREQTLLGVYFHKSDGAVKCEKFASELCDAFHTFGEASFKKAEYIPEFQRFHTDVIITHKNRIKGE